ncbi:hypothetical protein BH11PLA2_BH11PLA2_16680 [soil metagenome]
MRFVILLPLLVMIGCTPPGKPVPPAANAENSFDKLYAANCAGCHGANGEKGSAPPLNDLAFQTSMSEPEKLTIIREGRKGTAMPASATAKGGTLTDEQCQIIAKGMTSQWFPQAGLPNIVKRSYTGNAVTGKTLFAKVCASCHGANGEGGKFGDKTLGAINDTAYLALVSDDYLRRLIKHGRPDLNTPSGHVWGKDYLSPNDFDDLTTYLASWRKKP